MNSLENVKSRCTNDEVKKLLEQVPLEVLYDVYDLYNKTFEECEGDFTWKKYSAAASVYMLGFISGCRAIKERKRSIKNVRKN